MRSEQRELSFSSLCWEELDTGVCSKGRSETEREGAELGAWAPAEGARGVPDTLNGGETEDYYFDPCAFVPPTGIHSTFMHLLFTSALILAYL